MFCASSAVIVCRSLFKFLRSLPVALLLAIFLAPIYAQSGGGTDFTGTGGSHTIQGRLIEPSGRRTDLRLKVRLESTSSDALSVVTDNNGAFSFRSLGPGSYTITVEGGQNYEDVRETIAIDPEAIRTTMSVARNFTLPIYLRPKRSSNASNNRAKPALFDASLASVPKPAQAYYFKALEMAHAGATEKAIEQLQSAINLYPNFTLALNEMGVQYLKLNQPDKAIGMFASAVKTSPEAFTPRLNYSIMLVNDKKYTEAETSLRLALKKNESSGVAHLYLGRALIGKRSFDEAEKELQRAINTGSNEMSIAHYYLGGIYWGKREYKLAATELQTYLKLNPKAPNTARLQETIDDLQKKSSKPR